MITIDLYLKKSRPRGNGECSIYLRFTHNRVSKYRSTGINVYPKKWNDNKKRVAKSHPSYKALNGRLETFLYQAQEVYARLQARGSVTPDDIIYHLDHDESIEFFSASINLSKARGYSYHTRKQHKLALKYFKQYASVDRLSFQRITTDFLQGYIRFLEIDKALKPSTISKQIQPIKATLEWATENKYIAYNPFKNVTLPRQRGISTKTSLTESQLKAIEELDLDPGSKLDHARNAFMFQFYSFGMRWADLCTLRWSQIRVNRLVITHRKTGKDASQTLTTQQRKILDRYSKQDGGYVFPFLNDKANYSDTDVEGSAISTQNTLQNKRLKVIAEMAGIDEHITTHVARHSFAEFASRKVSLPELRQAMNHAKLATTQAYLRGINTESRDEASRKIYGSSD